MIVLLTYNHNYIVYSNHNNNFKKLKKLTKSENKGQAAMVLSDVTVKSSHPNTHKTRTVWNFSQLPKLNVNLTHFTHSGDETEGYYFPLQIGNGDSERARRNLSGSAKVEGHSLMLPAPGGLPSVTDWLRGPCALYLLRQQPDGGQSSVLSNAVISSRVHIAKKLGLLRLSLSRSQRNWGSFVYLCSDCKETGASSFISVQFTKKLGLLRLSLFRSQRNWGSFVHLCPDHKENGAPSFVSVSFCVCSRVKVEACVGRTLLLVI